MTPGWHAGTISAMQTTKEKAGCCDEQTAYIERTKNSPHSYSQVRHAPGLARKFRKTSLSPVAKT